MGLSYCPNITLRISVILCMASNGRYIDFTDKRVGYLTIIKRIEDNLNSQNDKIQWQAKCECGKIIIVSSRQLRRTPERSCGCKRRIHAPLFFRDPKQTNINNYLSSYKNAAQKRDLEWSLTKEEFENLISQNCYYCGLEPNIKHNVFNKTRYKRVLSEQAKQRHENGTIKTNGIDRVDSNLGYCVDNCVPCCKDCNYGKLSKTKDEFLEWINRIWIHQQSTQS